MELSNLQSESMKEFEKKFGTLESNYHLGSSEKIRDFLAERERIAWDGAIEKCKETVLKNSHEEYSTASGFLQTNTDKVMFELNSLTNK